LNILRLSIMAFRIITHVIAALSMTTFNIVTL
jgi:hypothetical protein